MQNRWPDEEHEPEAHVPLTSQQAEDLRQKLGSLKLEVFVVRVLMWQMFASVLMGILVWLLWLDKAMAASVFYGAMCAALPSALVAVVVKRRMSTDVLKHSGDMLLGLFVLELVKVAAAVCMLLATPLVLGSPHWVAVVVGFVLVLKIYWLVALLGLIGLRQPGHVHTLG